MVFKQAKQERFTHFQIAHQPQSNPFPPQPPFVHLQAIANIIEQFAVISKQVNAWVINKLK